MILHALGRFKDAIQCCNQALEIDPREANSWNTGRILGSMGQHLEAEQCFDEALEIDPFFALAWSNKEIDLRKLVDIKKLSNALIKPWKLTRNILKLGSTKESD